MVRPRRKISRTMVSIHQKPRINMDCPKCKKRIAIADLSPSVRRNMNDRKRKLQKISGQFNKHVNIFIGGKKPTAHVESLFFGREKNHDDGSITVSYPGDPWLSGVMRDLGFFKSTSEAKGAGWHKKARDGFTDEILTISGRLHRLCIYKQSKD